MMVTTTATAQSDLRWMLRNARIPRVRSMRRFAEDEIVIPDGPYADHRFRIDRQPYTGLWFDAIDSGRWTRFALTGDAQSSKSICGYVIPCIYHLFELGETVILGAQDAAMCLDKWRESILPMIEYTRYKDLLPRRGSGSRGGTPKSIQMSNGATLRFMTGGGSDKSRASFTSRVLIVTETDGMDEAGGASREADKIAQMEARTAAFGSRARIYLECTTSIKTGRIWREYESGTRTKIVAPCPHCRRFTHLSREDLVGWREAESLHEAREQARWRCPECDATWTEKERRRQLTADQLRAIHGDQKIDRAGRVRGDAPKTDTLSLRWHCYYNALKSTDDIVDAEYSAARDPNEDNAEKRMTQFWWATPYEPPEVSLATLTMNGVASRQRKLPRGIAPAGTTHITVGVDLGAYLSYWVAIAWLSDGTPHVVDYGNVAIPSNEMALEVAMPAALRQFRDETLMCGWLRDGTDSEMIVPSMVLVDAGNWQELVVQFTGESRGIMPAKGYGAGQYRSGRYQEPKSTGSTVLHIGDRYHVSLLGTSATSPRLIIIDVDHWKTFVHRRLQTPITSPGAMTLFQVDSVRSHYTWAKQLLSERCESEFTPGKGMVQKWKQYQRANHYFDSTMLASVAGHMAGVRISEQAIQAANAPGNAPPGSAPNTHRRPKPKRPAQTYNRRSPRGDDAWRPQPVGGKWQ